MGTFEQLYENLKVLLDEISSIQEKHKSPTFKFNGYPAAFVVPSGNESDYLTTNENQRIYAFKIWVFTEYDQTTGEISYETLTQCVDDVLDKVDEQENPENEGRDLASGLQSGYTLVAVLATPSRFALDEEEKLLGAEINVRLKVSVDLTEIV